MKRQVLCLLMAGLWANYVQVYAQSPTYGYFNDALVYSRWKPSGSARMLGMAGASNSLGADLSSTIGNPAGLGVYRKSEFSASVMPLINSTQAGGASSPVDSRVSNFNMAQIGAAFCSKEDDVVKSDFRGGTFAITYSRLNNLRSRSQYSNVARSRDAAGNRVPNRLIDQYSDLVNTPGYTADIASLDYSQLNNLQAEMKLAYFGYLLDSLDGGWGSLIPPGDVRQRGEVNTTGYVDELNFSYGFNIKDKFYFGTGLGVLINRYNLTTTYGEVIDRVDVDPSNPDFNNFNGADFTFTNSLRQRGTGVSLRIGGLYRVNDRFRLSGSFHQPMSFTIRESYDQRLSTNFSRVPYWYNTSSNIPVISDELGKESTFEYRLRMPGRATLGASYFFSKNGFITIDAEHVNFAAARLSSSLSDLSGDQNEINRLYKSVWQIRTGAEYRLNDFYRVRAGFGYYQNPVEGLKNNDLYFASLGWGYRTAEWFFDAAMVYHRSNDSFSYHPYMQRAEFKQGFVQFASTIGFFFE